MSDEPSDKERPDKEPPVDPSQEYGDKDDDDVVDDEDEGSPSA